MSAPGIRQHPRVLVLVSDPAVRDRIASLLRQALPDIEVDTPADRSGLRAVVGQGRIDLLLADPGGLVDDLLAETRRAGWPRGAPVAYVIAVAGGTSPGVPTLAGTHVDDFLLEPIRPEELVMRVRAGLDRVIASGCSVERATELEQLVARQREFLSLVSHEIRTPLSAIQSSANILLRYGSRRPDSVERFARVIHQEGQRLARLINNLLDLAKIEAGEVEWRFEPTPLQAILDRVRESFAAALGERSLELSVEAANGPVTLVADRDKLTQVLLNLVSNAVKHTPDGGRVRVRYGAPTAGGVRIEVEDEGDGVPPGDEERIFGRFQQLENGDERSGTGLGLTIARQIVEHHRGRVWAEPGRATGALFVVELPTGPPPEVGDGPV